MVRNAPAAGGAPEAGAGFGASTMTVASGLAAASFVLILAEAVVRLARADGFGTFGWFGTLVLGLYAWGFVQGTRSVRRDPKHPIAWSVLVVGSMVQALTYASAAVTLLLLTVVDRAYQPMAFSSRVPREVAPFVYLAVPALLLLGPLLGVVAARGARHGGLLAVASIVIAAPYVLMLGVALLALL